MAARTGRIVAVTPDRKGGVVRDLDDKNEYPLVVAGGKLSFRTDDLVLFEIEDEPIDKAGTTAKVAKPV
jgi:hypothetical protein